jgi:hypothetical protein
MKAGMKKALSGYSRVCHTLSRSPGQQKLILRSVLYLLHKVELFSQRNIKCLLVKLLVQETSWVSFLENAGLAI